MTTEEIIKNVDTKYLSNLPVIVKSLRDNNDPDELSYDIEEYEENLGDLLEMLIDRELCTPYDLGYVIHLILNDPENFYVYFQI
jgi:hypothetical protein